MTRNASTIAAAMGVGVVCGRMKQAIVARTDIGMGQGKLAAQVAHASLSAYEKADSQLRSQWKQGGQKKVVLKGTSERQLHELSEIADSKGVPNALIRDAAGNRSNVYSKDLELSVATQRSDESVPPP